jgi:hypothetical protein
LANTSSATSSARASAGDLDSGGQDGRDETVIADSADAVRAAGHPLQHRPAPKVHRGVQYDARYKRIWKAMRAASKATGIDWSPHYLRHLYAQLGDGQAAQVLVQQGLRHATGAMTAHYAKRKTTRKSPRWSATRS